ncbi:MAG: hypothetical protein WAK58_20705, partial [Trebonia sp.]
PEDAIHPLLEADADGALLGGSSDYLCHFAAGELPPAGRVAFPPLQNPVRYWEMAGGRRP